MLLWLLKAHVRESCSNNPDSNYALSVNQWTHTECASYKSDAHRMLEWVLTRCGDQVLTIRSKIVEVIVEEEEATEMMKNHTSSAMV